MSLLEYTFTTEKQIVGDTRFLFYPLYYLAKSIYKNPSELRQRTLYNVYTHYLSRNHNNITVILDEKTKILLKKYDIYLIIGTFVRRMVTYISFS